MASLLQVQNLTKSYGGQLIFSRLSFAVTNQQKIGVIGRNGAGKSTVFRIITGQETADSGQVVINPATRLGYLEQQADWLANESGLAYLQRKSDQATWRCLGLASRFKLTTTQLEQPIQSLSGGWQMRIKLSAMLLLEPNLFLLDEPTNYLDITTQILLEKFLKTYNGSFLIISHDRQFLKNTCQETLEITAQGSRHFPRPLDEYLEYKTKKLISQTGYNQKVDRQSQHLQEFVDRFRYKASKATQAQSKIKQLAKLANQTITIDHDNRQTRINLPIVEKRKNWTLHAERLAIGYNQQIIVDKINLEISGGQKVIVLGDNGQGKTTLLKTIIGQLPPISGSFQWLPGLNRAYYAQHTSDLLNHSEQVGDYLRRLAAPDIKTEAVLQMASDFLFQDDDLKKPINILSGGEKSRLCLAGLLLGRPDILVLDEPTSHLDFTTTEALGQALQQFNGTIIFTSHDRSFASLLATNIIELSNGQARRYPYNYNDYIYYLENGQLAKPDNQVAVDQPDTDQPSAHHNYLAQKAKQRQATNLEKEFQRLRQKQTELLAYFSNQTSDYRHQAQKAQELQEINQTLSQIEAKWLKLID